jgi:polysaccharide export outer membrane protein
MCLRDLIRICLVSAALSVPPISAVAQNSAASIPDTTQLLDGARNDADGNSRATVGKDALNGDRRPQYVIGPADVIHINVWKDTDLSQTVTVDPNGFVSLPLVGDIHVAGMTTDQMAAVLGSRLASFVVSPQVTVSVVDIRSRQVYVMGKVGKAGGYPLITPVTVLQLIAEAGGLNPYAKRKDIYVLRSANGRTEKLSFNYDQVTRGNGSDNIVLQPGDTVIVP